MFSSKQEGFFSPHPQYSNPVTGIQPVTESPERYKLNLTQLIEARNNPEYYGRVLAYFEKHFMTLAASRTYSTTEIIPFANYLSYISCDVHQQQRSKYNHMEKMVQLINRTYINSKRSLVQHSCFCDRLLHMVDFAMCVDVTTCNNLISEMQLLKLKIKKSHKSTIKNFWTELLRENPLSEADSLEYNNQLYWLLINFDQSLSMNNKISELTKKCIDSVKKDKRSDVCISWTYFDVLCNIFEIKDPLLKEFNHSYIKQSAGLANDMFFVPDFWAFIIKSRKEHKKNDLGELLKKIDKTLSSCPSLQYCKPIDDNKGFSLSLRQ